MKRFLLLIVLVFSVQVNADDPVVFNRTAYEAWLSECSTDYEKVVDQPTERNPESNWPVAVIYKITSPSKSAEIIDCLIADVEVSERTSDTVFIPSPSGLTYQVEQIHPMVDAILQIDDEGVLVITMPDSANGVTNVQLVSNGAVVITAYAWSHHRVYLLSKDRQTFEIIGNGIVTVLDGETVLKFTGVKTRLRQIGYIWIDMLQDLDGNLLDIVPPEGAVGVECVSREEFIEMVSDRDLSRVTREKICYED